MGSFLCTMGLHKWHVLNHEKVTHIKNRVRDPKFGCLMDDTSFLYAEDKVCLRCGFHVNEIKNIEDKTMQEIELEKKNKEKVEARLKELEYLDNGQQKEWAAFRKSFDWTNLLLFMALCLLLGFGFLLTGCGVEFYGITIHYDPDNCSLIHNWPNGVGR